MELVTPLIEAGGCDTVYVMPNLQPPIKTVSEALSYHQQLTSLAPNVTFLMSLFLHPDLTPSIIADAAKSGIIYGVKLYPAGVTTNSSDGVLDIEYYYPIFAAMEEHNLILNLHGEMVSSSPNATSFSNRKEAISVLNAEPKFLPQLFKLHTSFPNLRIILEHVSTAEGIEAVKKCGDTVTGTITAHHLWMTIDDWCSDVFSFCKPVAKTPSDRLTLIRAVVESQGKFFFGSDSAPHSLESKKERGKSTPAGCFTQPWCTGLVIGALEEGVKNGWIGEEDVSREVLEGFLSTYGKKFYQVEEAKERRLVLEKKGERIKDVVRSHDGNLEVVPFGAGKEVWSVSWKS